VFSTLPRQSGSSYCCTATWMCRSRRKARNPLTGSDESSFQEAPKHNHHLGSYGHGPGSSADQEPCFSVGRTPCRSQFSQIYFDISWDEVAKYVVSSPEATRVTPDLLNRYQDYQDRFLFGTDEVAPANHEQYLRVY
jgi:hypothetical protein